MAHARGAADYRTIHAFRILLEEIAQEDTPALLKEHMPNCCIWWYSRRDVSGARARDAASNPHKAPGRGQSAWPAGM